MHRPRLASFFAEGAERYGLMTERGMVDLWQRFRDRWPTLQAAIEQGDLRELADLGDKHPVTYFENEISWSIPIANPEKIICVGVNYPDRNEEYKDGQEAARYPSLFPRFPRSFVGHGHSLIRPRVSEQLDYEGEVVIIIGKAGRHIAEADALNHIAGLSLCNEGSIRDWVRHGKFNVTPGKNFDASGALGPWLVPFEEESQIADIRLTTRVNGELRQEDRTGRMIFSFRYLLAYISSFTTLVPGDVIVTGTPTGAGARLNPPKWLKPGDVIEVEAEGIGILRNGVIDEGAE